MISGINKVNYENVVLFILKWKNFSLLFFHPVFLSLSLSISFSLSFSVCSLTYSTKDIIYDSQMTLTFRWLTWWNWERKTQPRSQEKYFLHNFHKYAKRSGRSLDTWIHLKLDWINHSLIPVGGMERRGNSMLHHLEVEWEAHWGTGPEIGKETLAALSRIDSEFLSARGRVRREFSIVACQSPVLQWNVPNDALVFQKWEKAF